MSDEIPVRSSKRFVDVIEATSVEALLNGEWIQLVSCYIPPGSVISAATANAFASFLNNPNCLIGGDFNARHIAVGDMSNNSLGVWLSSFCFDQHFDMLNSLTPTCFQSAAGSFLDKFLSRNICSENFCYAWPSFSDHCCIQTVSKFATCTELPNLHTLRAFSWTKVSQLNKFICAELDKLNLPSTCNLSDTALESVCSAVHEIFKTAVDKFVPFRQVKFDKVVLSQNTIVIRQHLRRALRKFNRNRYLPHRFLIGLRGEIKHLNRTLVDSIKSDIANYYGNLLVNIKDMHSFFHTVGSRKRAGKSPQLPELRDENGQPSSGDDAICQVFSSHFCKNHNLTVRNSSWYDRFVAEFLTQFNADNSWRIPISSESPALNCDGAMLNPLFVTPDYVVEVIQALNSKLSVGTDNMPNRLLKLLDSRAYNFLALLFNHLIANGVFPSCWKNAIVTPIPKAGKSRASVLNWRPISMLCCVSKVFERIIADRIRNFCARNSIIPNHQFGFQVGHSTYHPLAILLNKLNDGLNKNMITTMICLDIQAAFDTVWHDGLIYKLYQLDFPRHLLHLLYSFLRNRTFRVKFGRSVSDSMQIPAGVPQGSVLGPLLFNLSTVDIPTDSKFKLLQYADDTCISMSFSHVLGVSSAINKYLSRLARWYDTWKFKLNEAKTDVLHVVGSTKQVSIARRKLKGMKIVLNGVVIEPKSTVKYLGLHFARNNKFTHHINTTLQKVAVSKARLGAFIHSRLIEPKFKKFLFTMYLRPILTYACPIWLNPSNISRFQVERCRIFERKLIRATYNVFRTKDNFKYLSNKKLYQLYDYDKLDIFMAKLSVRFHKGCLLSENPEINKLFKTRRTANIHPDFWHRTDFLTSLDDQERLFDSNDELLIFN